MTDAPTTAVLWSPAATRLPALAALARKREAEIVATFAPNGPGSEKAEWPELMALACGGKVGLVIAASICSLPGDLNTIITLAEVGVGTLTVDEPFLTGGAEVVAALRWIHSRAVAQRQDARRIGTARAVAAGRRPGRPRVMIPMEAIQAVKGGIRLAQAARAYSVSETSLRRAIQAAEALGLHSHVQEATCPAVEGDGGPGGTLGGFPQGLRSPPTFALQKRSDF